MRVSVVTVQPDIVVLNAPLAANINQHDTVFGGSASALAILAAWSLLHTRMSSEGIANRLMIQRNTMEYERPIRGEFTATSSFASLDEWQRFIHTLTRRGRARITVSAILESAGQIAGKLTGDYVAFTAKNA